MQSEYDLIVVGAGPAGSMAARIAAKAGLSVLVLEQKKVIGYPSHCAGGILTLILDQMGLISEVKKSIKTQIRSFRVHSPLMRSVFHNFKRTIGYVVDRPVFDQLLSESAQREGAEILTQAKAIGLQRGSRSFNQVLVKYRNENHRINTKIIIGADGVASNVAKWAGLTIPHKYTGIGFSYNADNLKKISSDTVEIYFISALPGGYGWIFPQSSETANIGLGGYNSGTYMKKVFKWFRNKHPIASEKLSSAHLTAFTGGVVPGSKVPRKTTFNYGMIVGDAANQIDSLTGEGIRLSLICGELAGRVAASALQRDQLPKIHHYHKLWRQRISLELFANYFLRHFFMRFDAEDFDTFVSAIERTNLNLLFRRRRWIPLIFQSIFKTPTILKMFKKSFVSLPPYVNPFLYKS